MPLCSNQGPVKGLLCCLPLFLSMCWSPTHDLVLSCFGQLPNRGVPLPIAKLPHLSTTGPKPCKPFHLMSAVTTLKVVDPKSAGILKPLLWVTGSSGSPAGTPAALEDLLSTTCNSTPSSCHFSFTFSPARFSPSDWQFPMLSSNQENCL